MVGGGHWHSLRGNDSAALFTQNMNISAIVQHNKLILKKQVVVSIKSLRKDPYSGCQIWTCLTLGTDSQGKVHLSFKMNTQPLVGQMTHNLRVKMRSNISERIGCEQNKVSNEWHALQNHLLPTLSIPLSCEVYYIEGSSCRSQPNFFCHQEILNRDYRIVEVSFFQEVDKPLLFTMPVPAFPLSDVILTKDLLSVSRQIQLAALPNNVLYLPLDSSTAA